uniref:BURP domain-containing protein n=1 Tax=Oryza nivara TaxID=4536 RepID=A0A0E0GII9_ORYNI
MYWKIALPTSPMPGAIRDLINPASSAGSASKEDTVGNVSTLAECEAAPQAGEAKRCATSLESMVEFAASSLGTRDVHAVSTEVDRAGPAPRQAYRVEAVRPVPVSGGDMVACHGMAYAYAVFGCHTTTAAAYMVALSGADGTRAEALAACHADAAPGVAEAYKRLGVAPGSVPVCHFLPQDDMLWVRN